MDNRIAEYLKLSILEEKQAAKVYRERAKYATRVGDAVAARLWLKIAKEEDEHAVHYLNLLKKRVGK